MARYFFAILIPLVIIWIGISLGSGFVIGIGIVVLMFYGFIFFLKFSKNSSAVASGKEWTSRYPSAKYSFAHGEYGIAVEEENIHLMDDGRVKSYPFADVRSWKTNLQTGGTTTFVGGGALNAISVGSANNKQLKDNDKASGLFVSVRDVDKPIWRIKFSDKQDEEEKQQARWMEILNQVVNKA